jgi:hypothetical protein
MCPALGIGKEQREEWEYERSRGKRGNRQGAEGRVGIGEEQREPRESARRRANGRTDRE